MNPRSTLKFCALFLVVASFIANAQTLKIPLSGVGQIPSSSGLSLNPTLLENGQVELGTQKSQQFSISHTGNAKDLDIEIFSVTVGGQDPGDFITDYVGYNVISAGQTLNFDVTFSPVSLGAKKAFLRIEHSGENSPHLVLMTGSGVDVPASELVISTTDLEFGTIEVFTNTDRTLTLTNAGPAGNPAINIFNATISGDNTDFTTNFGNIITLNPGQSTNIVTTMSSTIAGQKSAQLSLDHDGSNPTIRVDLNGTASLPPEPDPIDDDPQSPGPTPVNPTTPKFLTTKLNNAAPAKPTSLQFGPNGNLYVAERDGYIWEYEVCLLYTSPSPRDGLLSRMPSSA